MANKMNFYENASVVDIVELDNAYLRQKSNDELKEIIQSVSKIEKDYNTFILDAYNTTLCCNAVISERLLNSYKRMTVDDVFDLSIDQPLHEKLLKFGLISSKTDLFGDMFKILEKPINQNDGHSIFNCIIYKKLDDGTKTWVGYENINSGVKEYAQLKVDLYDKLAYLGLLYNSYPLTVTAVREYPILEFILRG